MLPVFLAPLLSQGLSLIGNAVMAKGKEWVEEKTGVKLDQPLSAEDTLKLRQYEMEHEEELLRLRIEDKRLDLSDVQGARDMNTRINESANATWLSKNVPAILALVVISVGFILINVVWLMRGGNMKAIFVRTFISLGFAALAWMQYRWLGQLSEAERERIRMQRGIDRRTRQLAEERAARMELERRIAELTSQKEGVNLDSRFQSSQAKML